MTKMNLKNPIKKKRKTRFKIFIILVIIYFGFCYGFYYSMKDNKKIQLRINRAEFFIFKFYILLMSIMTIITVTISANNFTIIYSPCPVPYRGHSFFYTTFDDLHFPPLLLLHLNSAQDFVPSFRYFSFELCSNITYFRNHQQA